MTDPIENPVDKNDKIYQDLGPPNYQRIPNSKQLRADAVKRQQQREQSNLIAVLKTDAGQEVLMRLLAFAGVHRTTEGDLAAEGRRQVGLWLISAISEADPELYPLLLQAHLQRQRRFAAAEAAIAENHRRNPGIVRKATTSVRDFMRSAGSAIADRVW